jgi:hypothetical protein
MPAASMNPSTMPLIWAHAASANAEHSPRSLVTSFRVFPSSPAEPRCSVACGGLQADGVPARGAACLWLGRELRVWVLPMVDGHVEESGIASPHERVAVAAFIAGFSDPTRRSYTTNLRIFSGWCHDHGIKRHDVIVQSVIAVHGGCAFSTAGDSFAVAVSCRPGNAVAAAVDAQRRLSSEPWRASTPLEVVRGQEFPDAISRNMSLSNSASVEPSIRADGPTLQRPARRPARMTSIHI